MYGGAENLWDDENDGGGEHEGSKINAVGENHGSNKRMRMMEQVSMTGFMWVAVLFLDILWVVLFL